MANASAKIEKQKAKERAAKADSYELHPKRPITRNGWFALGLSVFCVVAAILVLWGITQI